MTINTSQTLIEDILSRGAEEIIESKSLAQKLGARKKLRVKHGVDPTTKDLHIGHAVIYEKLRALQEMGHQIVFLIGDFTARFGDPTQKLEARTMRSKKEVKGLSQNYIRQAGKILNLKKLEIRYNGEWYDKMSAEDLLGLMSRFTAMRMLERDMFRERIKKNMDIRLHEPVYPVLQGYDSVMLESDLTVCGTDQIFNELQGRKLQEEFGQPPQDIIAMSILVGIDGKQKMSQSLGNYIGVTEAPGDQYGKTMSIPDEIIPRYFELATRMPLGEVEKIKSDLKNNRIKPRNAKARLAREIVAIYHGERAAEKAEEEFNKVFKRRELPSQIPEIIIKKDRLNILDLLVEARLAFSRSEAKRLVEQAGVKINGKTINDWQAIIAIKRGTMLQVGKRRFVKIA